MSQENVELHRRANEAFNARDVEGFIRYCHPDIELHSAVTVPGGGLYRGHDGIRRWHRDLAEVFGGEIEMIPEAFFDLGEYTVTFHVLHGRGRQSGAHVGTPAAHLCRWQDRLMVYFKGYVHREDVFSDFGVPQDDWNESPAKEMSEQDAHAEF
jgi:ketosteroid isomerase-like protein